MALSGKVADRRARSKAPPLPRNMTTPARQTPSSSLHPDSARPSPLSRTVTSQSALESGASLPPLLRTVSSASTAPSVASSVRPALARTQSNLSILPPSKPSSRLSLKYQAHTWRFLEGIGVYIDTWGKPVPPNPSFTRLFPTTDITPAHLELAFYVPNNYEKQKRLGHRYPVVVNFHGGGFTLGSTRDDARWAAYVLKDTPAVFVSVEYRLAPEFPFPTAVEDGVEALLHIAAHAEEYAINPKRIALSGFSAGGNLSFTIPLRLQDHIKELKANLSEASWNDPSVQPNLPSIITIISFYPALDMRISRAQRRAGALRPDKTLPPILTTLFDSSYMPDEASKSSPYASPPVASDETLEEALPNRIAFYLCEWDMLLEEGKGFAERLKHMGKNVDVTIIKERRHAFDKAPSPFGVDKEVGLCYSQACKILKDSFALGRRGALDISAENA